ncbi:MAG: phosphoglycerol geranylgeranyltransferase [Parvicellaceae bacterium]|jgi:phosphoglycerol geranylgeranyltransferase
MKLLKSDRKLAILVDPDKWSSVDQMSELVDALKLANPDFVLVGGSLITNDLFERTIIYLKEQLTIPVFIFPGNGLQVSSKADGIFLLSLISGRNPEFLIGQHVIAAPLIARSDIEIIPTGYMLIDGGNITAAAYMSNTQPIPAEKYGIAASTALAGQQLGMQQIYMDAGSGALNSISNDMIKSVADSTKIPLVVGGGIKSVKEVQAKWEAGANLVVIGTAIEKNLGLLNEFVTTKEQV